MRDMSKVRSAFERQRRLERAVGGAVMDHEMGLESCMIPRPTCVSAGVAAG
jgi:hypothetical protein